ncbi:hypothetical protein M0811_00036 [Anaeramoeba ignava]|uniref:Tyr recombinase domain-containing protein n=1 Tax=Anaeramoeba ignava TaxID=1746090 RepID=A0A9Q0RE26_ANAIG|nr:hypothetical protein M0811_00036 [Anaeramoeba ignava]
MRNFEPISEAEIQAKALASTPTATRESTRYAMRLWENYCQVLSISSDFLDHSIADLNHHLSSCILQAKRLDNSEFHANTIYYIVAAWNRVYEEESVEKQQPVLSFLRSSQFIQFQKVVDEKIRRLAEKGKSEVEHTMGLTREEFDKCLQSCDIDTPRGLTMKLLLLLGKFCAFRGGVYHKLKMKHFTLKRDQNQTPYYEIKQYIMKNRQRGLKQKNEKAQINFIYNNETIQLIALYLDKRSSNTNKRFFLGINQSKNARTWYTNSPISYHNLNKMFKKHVHSNEINKQISLHSLRVSSIQC